MSHAELLAAEESTEQATNRGRKWGLLVAVVLCLAFWVAVIASIVELF